MISAPEVGKRWSKISLEEFYFSDWVEALFASFCYYFWNLFLGGHDHVEEPFLRQSKLYILKNVYFYLKNLLLLNETIIIEYSNKSRNDGKKKSKRMFSMVKKLAYIINYLAFGHAVKFTTELNSSFFLQ